MDVPSEPWTDAAASPESSRSSRLGVGVFYNPDGTLLIPWTITLRLSPSKLEHFRDTLTTSPRTLANNTTELSWSLNYLAKSASLPVPQDVRLYDALLTPGIGRAIAERLLQGGGIVIGSDVMLFELPGMEAKVCDQGSPESILELEKWIKEKWVNCRVS
jgi:hypothetical protein